MTEDAEIKVMNHEGTCCRTRGVSHGRMNPNRSLDRMCLYIFRAFMLSAILLFYIGLFLLDHY